MPPDEQQRELDLRDYVRVLYRRKVTILVVGVAITALAVAFSYVQAPVYAATARVLVRSSGGESLFDPNTGARNDPERAVQTEIEVLKSEPVQEAVRDEIGRVPGIQARAVRQSDVIEVQSKSSEPEMAAEAANAYADAFIDFRRQQSVEDLVAAGEEIQRKIAELQSQIDAVDGQINSAPTSQQETVRESLNPQRDGLIQQQGLFKQRLDQLQVDATLNESGAAQVVTRAAAPSSPVQPKPIRNGVLALAFGLVAGTGVAFLREHLDDSLKTKDDVERAVPGLAVLGLIPAVPSWKAKEEARVVSVRDSGSPAAEAYRTLRTSIQFFGLDRPLRTLQITSPSAQEGKTTTLVNLGVALARAGQRVAMVCCDLRRPRLHEFFGLTNKVGFTSVLLGDAPLSVSLQEVPGEDRLQLLSSGPLPPNPSELLASPRAAEVLQSLQAQVDVVLVDCPPVLPVTDALILSSRVDATLLVCVAGSTTRKGAHRSAELLRQVGAPLVGTVLNGVSGADTYGYAYKHRYRDRSAYGPVAERPPVPAEVDGNGEQSDKPVPAKSDKPSPAKSDKPSPANAGRKRGGRSRKRARAG